MSVCYNESELKYWNAVECNVNNENWKLQSDYVFGDSFINAQVEKLVNLPP